MSQLKTEITSNDSYSTDFTCHDCVRRLRLYRRKGVFRICGWLVGGGVLQTDQAGRDLRVHILAQLKT